ALALLPAAPPAPPGAPAAPASPAPARCRRPGRAASAPPARPARPPSRPPSAPVAADRRPPPSAPPSTTACSRRSRARVPARAARTAVAQPSQANLLVSGLREQMDRIDEADAVAARAQHDRLGAGALREVPHAAEQGPVRDAGADHHLVAPDEVIDAEDLVDVVDAVLAGLPDLGAAHRPKLPLDLTAPGNERGTR